MNMFSITLNDNRCIIVSFGALVGEKPLDPKKKAGQGGIQLIQRDGADIRATLWKRKQ